MFKSLIALLFAFTCINAQAADMTAPQWELSGGTNAKFVINSTGSNAAGVSGPTTRNFNLTGQAGYFFMPQWEVALNLNANINNANGATTSSWPILVGLVYNFDSNVTNSIFVEGLVGLTILENGPGVNSPNYSLFTYKAGVGKRFAITSSISYKPEVTFGGTTSKTVTVGNASATVASTTTWGIIPLQFSFIW
jgi:hypothetical protein